MKHLTTLTSLAIACSLLAGCDEKQDRPHQDAPPVGSPATDGDRPREGGPLGLEKDKMGHNAPSDRADQPGLVRDGREAEADIEPAKGMKLKGEVELKETSDGVEIEAKIKDASPGMHGFHIHEKGDCSDLPGESMGAHFNPDGKDHMLPHEGDARHLGDLGNIEVGDDGKGEVKFTLKGASLQEGHSHSLLGRSFVVHERKDLGQEKQPAGDSGAPIACGVIKKD